MNLIDRTKFIHNAILTKNVSYLIFFVTSRCNAKCHHCFYWNKLNNDEEELSLSQIQQLCSKYKYFQYVTLTGGEPFLRNDLPEIVSAFHKLSGTRLFVIPTNGTLRDRMLDYIEKMVKKRKNIFIKFQFSVDGVGTDHDELRGIPNLYEDLFMLFKDLRTMQIKYPRFSLDITTAMTSSNKNKMEKIIDAVEKDFKPDNHNIALARLDSRTPEIADVSVNEYLAAISYLLEKRKPKERKPFSGIIRAMYNLNTRIVAESREANKMAVPCVCGEKMIIIRENGAVLPCELRPQEMGNLKDYDMDLGKLLQSEQAQGVLGRIKKGYCPPCSWECAIFANVLMNPKLYGKLLKPAFKEYFNA